MNLGLLVFLLLIFPSETITDVARATQDIKAVNDDSAHSLGSHLRYGF